MLAHRVTPILNVSDIGVLCQGAQGGRGHGGVNTTDMPWGVREMYVRHPDGHVFRISKGIGDTHE